MKKLTALALILAVLVASGTALINAGGFPLPAAGEVESGEFARRTDELLAGNLPEREALAEIASRISYVSGQREFDGVFIADDESLIKNMEEPGRGYVESALNSVKSFVQKHEQRTYFMLIPTAAVIKQQEIPQYAAETLYNQRHMINDCYQELAGTVTTVDVYQTLFNHRAEQIYYNTADNLTGLGGYYVYGELCARMGLRERLSASFDIGYGAHGFYGALADDFLRGYTRADVVAMYSYTAYERKYTLTHVGQDGTRTEHDGLYYAEDEVGTDKTDMILGGLSPMIETDIVSPYSEWLLVFGDHTAKGWLPFLMNHYAHVTYVDIAEATPAQLSAIDVTDYQQVLFAYSTATLGAGAGLGNLSFID